MDFQPLPFRAALKEYEQQAVQLLDGWNRGDAEVIGIFRHKHPRFLDSDVPWLPKDIPDEQLRRTELDLSDAQLAVARGHDFRDWTSLTLYVEAVRRDDSPEFRFEWAVEAVIHGDLAALRSALSAHPDLVDARSTRVTHFDPPVHGATLLHYLGANGVEGYRQKSPPNAVEIARALLEYGAEPDALAGMYGGRHTTMSMLVSSSPPAEAGVQIPLIEVLLDFGASVEGHGSGNWTSPLMTALAFGFTDAAETLVRRGAKVNTASAAAGLGRVEDVERLLPQADPLDRHRALALAAQHGHPEVVRLLLDAGQDPNRYNPKGNHAHSTPLHQAVWSGHQAVVQLFVERGARLDMPDTIYRSTPRGWAVYGGRAAIAEYLQSVGAP